MNVIETKSLTKSYGKARGIVDLTLTVEQGEWFGFIGPNGAGKSTTIRTLLGLIFPTSGSAKVLGLDVVKQKEEILRRTGYLPSEALFYPGMKVKDILKFSADLRKTDCSKTAAGLCDRLQLDVNRKVDELSFGNRKKVAIVTALQSKPELLILDEPTSGLDPLMQHEFFEIIREYNKEGATVFVSSHILPEIQRNCDRAGVIREGRLIACDSVEALSQSNAKRVSFRGDVSVDGLTGVKDISINGETRSFLYSGDINALIGKLAVGDVKDLTITDPDLDEIFMHFYGSETDRKTTQKSEPDNAVKAKTQDSDASITGKEEN
ncbi:MAG: ABC transporter ATP-binding protein [Lachnospiraceae bacterium]|nr:ABC transporter ATP-binding protein [Lachnospiraceae bacterium]